MHDKHCAVHKNSHFKFPRESKKITHGESDMLIGTSRQESVISLLLFIVVLHSYQIYQFLKLVYDLFKPEFHMLRYKIVCTQGTRYRCCRLQLNFHRYFEIKTKL